MVDQGIVPSYSIVPELVEGYDRADLLPRCMVAPDRVFLCRRVYDARQKRIFRLGKHPYWNSMSDWGYQWKINVVLFGSEHDWTCTNIMFPVISHFVNRTLWFFSRRSTLNIKELSVTIIIFALQVTLRNKSIDSRNKIVSCHLTDNPLVFLSIITLGRKVVNFLETLEINMYCQFNISY